MQEIKITLASAASMLILVAKFSPLLYKVACGESASQVPSPDGWGPYPVGWIDTSISKTGGGVLPLSVYYPSIVTGEGNEPNTADSPYPTLLFGLGYSSTIDNYRLFAFTIASWGFVFAVVGSEIGAWDSPRVADLTDALNWLDGQNDNSSFKLSQMMDESKFGVLGHSLGGEAAIAVAISDSRLKTVIPIAPFIAPPMTIISPESAADVHIPILTLVGSADIISPPSTMTYPFYDKGSPPKFCITLMGVDHINIIFTCSKYVVSFLKFYLYKEQEYARYLYGSDAQQEIIDGKIGLMYDLRRIFEYEIIFKGISYNLSVYSDSDFLNLFFDETLMEMNFTLTGPPYTGGTANITIPKQIVGDYTVEVCFDGEFYPFELSNSSLSYFVYIAYNHSQHQLTIDFVDLVPPILFITSPVANSTLNSPNVTVTWFSEDYASGLDYFEVKVDEETWINVDNARSYVLTGLDDGHHVTYVKAFDKAENTEEASANFTVDTTPPLLSIISPTVNSIINLSNVTVAWSGLDSISGIAYYEVKLNDGLWINLETNVSYVFVWLADANYTVFVKTVDKAGNPSETQVNFTVKAKPNPTLLWMQWWFWAIVGVAVVLSLGFALHVRRRKLASTQPLSASHAYIEYRV